MIYWILILFYVALIIQELVSKNYWKAFYFACAIGLTISLMKMNG